jgi:hypothetical protein
MEAHSTERIVMDPESNVIAMRIVRDALNGQPFSRFRPVAYWKDSLDTIEVVIKDASYCEIGSPSGFPITLYVDNYPEKEGTREYVGFEISCASTMCLLYNLIHNRTVNLHRLLDALAEGFPEYMSDLEVARRLVREHSLDTVEMS